VARYARKTRAGIISISGSRCALGDEMPREELVITAMLK
jgi:hypothetical protein